MMIVHRVGHPVMVDLQQGLHLRHGGIQPVTVEVVPVVVATSTRPRFAELLRLRVSHVTQAAVGVYPCRETGDAIRILSRDQGDDCLVEQSLDLWALSGRKEIGERQGGVYAGSLIAVDRHHHAGYGGKRLWIYACCGIG